MKPEVQVREVIHTRLKKVGNGRDVPIHTHEQFWSLDGKLLAENCEGDYCTDPRYQDDE